MELSKSMDMSDKKIKPFDIFGNFEFSCPICHKEFSIFDAQEESVCIKSENLPTEFHGRLVIRKYRDTYAKVRLCKKCYRKRRRNLKCFIGINVMIFIVFNIIYGINYFSHDNNGIATYIGLLLLIAFIFPIISGFLFWIYLKATEIDISEAIKGNAITDY